LGIVDRLLYVEPATKKHCTGPNDIPFYQRQSRTVLKACGFLDPESIDEYMSHGGYEQAKRAFTKLSAKDICDEISFSGLRGRGGGGFPTGKKWELTRVQPGPKKYVICNGDEGDPGHYGLKRYEGNPHSVIEGIISRARQSVQTMLMFMFVLNIRLRLSVLRKAVQDAYERGILGGAAFSALQTELIAN
jgi:NADH-quinone oxidoreductase subunit F